MKHIGSQIANGGGLEALALDTAGRVVNQSYGERVALHESGHFLVAYMLGWLPRAYTLSSLDAFQTWVIPSDGSLYPRSLYLTIDLKLGIVV